MHLRKKPPLVIHLVVAARPNFMKVAPLYHELKNQDWCKLVLVHTDQHYDTNMSGDFFDELGLPSPDFSFQVGSHSHGKQTAMVLTQYEAVCLETPPDLVIVVGDVNSTMACTLAAKKLNLNVAHLEAGIRSGDRTMPEEMNRLVTDTLADVLWTPTECARDNLKREGIAEDRIEFVGNIMIDSLLMQREHIERQNAPAHFGLNPHQYGVLTLHRPSNVDDVEILKTIITNIQEVSRTIPLIFPVHPRTRLCLIESGLWQRLKDIKGIKAIDPIGYREFMSLVMHAQLVLTDSGGIQEETTYLGIPCLTLRENTERPITLTEGTNRLIIPSEIRSAFKKVLSGNWPTGTRPKFWDGKTAGRVSQSIQKYFGIKGVGLKFWHC